MSSRKTYFLVPTFDILPPPTGTIALGAILSAPDRPSRPLNLPNLRHLQIPSHLPISKFTETDWSKIISKTTGGSLGVFAQFLSLTGIGGEVWASGELSKEDVFAFNAVETTAFEPDDAFTEGVVKTSEQVKDFMRRNWIGVKRPMYIVTGYKVVKGAKITRTKTWERAIKAQVGVDLTAVGAPVSPGPSGEVNRKGEEKTSTKISEDFVFAYRLRRIKWKKRGKVVETQDYEDGAFLQEEEEEDAVEEFDIEEVEKEDVRMDTAQPAIDDENGEECFCVLPKSRQAGR
jgi:hypothetical protein